MELNELNRRVSAPALLRASRMALRSGSTAITMPGPPPYGLSSTVRWRSCAKSRGSTVSSRT